MLELWYQHNKHKSYPQKDESTSRVAYVKNGAVHFRFLGGQNEPEVGEEELGTIYEIMQELGRAVQYALHYGTSTEIGYSIWLSVRKKLKQIITLDDKSEIKPIAIVIDGHKETV